MTAHHEKDFFERHGARVELGAPSGCWLWSGATRPDNYGRVVENKKTHLAHRRAYEAVHGEGSAEDLVVRHSCDTPSCVNPAHLIVGTQADNVRDRDERGRRTAPKGEAHTSAKLTEADVRAIRSEYIFGSSDYGQLALAKRFGVVRTLIQKVVCYKTWTHVP